MAKLQEIKRKKGRSAYFIVLPLGWVDVLMWKPGDMIKISKYGKEGLKLELVKGGKAN